MSRDERPRAHAVVRRRRPCTARSPDRAGRRTRSSERPPVDIAESRDRRHPILAVVTQNRFVQWNRSLDPAHLRRSATQCPPRASSRLLASGHWTPMAHGRRQLVKPTPPQNMRVASSQLWKTVVNWFSKTACVMLDSADRSPFPETLTGAAPNIVFRSSSLAHGL